jgi:YVTN family beta-propeller protein
MALVGNVKDSTVSVIDIAARAAIGTVPVSSLPSQGGPSLAVLPDGTGALVVNPGGSSLLLI